ncbi:MAG: flippase-like domain-containing protein [Acidimicrobiia bacterium]|nr:flippase-like domain-containing protein [Acidimicrobiia bacterium]
MRTHVRTIAVLALAVSLLALFLWNVDLRGVLGEIVRARPEWLLLSVATMFVSLSIRAWRWQYLLEPLGSVSFSNSFQATAVGFAASSVLPARAGEVIRPYFLARRERLSATGAFATIVLERVLDTLTVLLILASYVFVFGRELGSANPVAFAAMKGIGAVAGGASLVALAVLFYLARDPAAIGQALGRLARVVPSKLAGSLAQVAEKFATGLGTVRRPDRLIMSLALSFPLWLCISLGIWSVVRAFHLPVPFTGSFLLNSMLVIGVAVPTPGAVGGFHEAVRIGLTLFFGARNDAAVGAAIVLHAFSIVPSLLLGLMFAAQEGINFSRMRQLASEVEPGRTA